MTMELKNKLQKLSNKSSTNWILLPLKTIRSLQQKQPLRKSPQVASPPLRMSLASPPLRRPPPPASPPLRRPPPLANLLKKKIPNTKILSKTRPTMQPFSLIPARSWPQTGWCSCSERTSDTAWSTQLLVSAARECCLCQSLQFNNCSMISLLPPR